MSTLAQRSVLGRSGFPLDQIHLAGIAARGFHGVLESERAAGQDFSADVTLYLDTRPAARGDDLTETVNYALVAQDVADILSGAPVNLIETVAEQIAAAVLARPAVVAVDVAVHKPQAPIPVPFADVVVAIHRDRTHPAVVASPVDDAAAGVDASEPVELETAETAPTAAAESDAVESAVPVAAVPVTAVPVAAVPVAAGTAAVTQDLGVLALGVQLPEPTASNEQAPGAEPESAESVETVVFEADAPAPAVVVPTAPMVISRPADPSDDGPGSVFVAPVGAPLDAPLDARLDAPLDAPLDEPLVAEVPATTGAIPAMPPVPFPDPTTTADAATTTVPEQEPAAEPTSFEPVAGHVESAEPAEPAEPAVVEPAPITSPLGIDLTAVLTPLDEGVLAEQARLSEQSRRPEVFGMATLSTDWASPITTDSAATPPLTAPEDFLTAETFAIEAPEAYEPDGVDAATDSAPTDSAATDIASEDGDATEVFDALGELDDEPAAYEQASHALADDEPAAYEPAADEPAADEPADETPANDPAPSWDADATEETEDPQATEVINQAAYSEAPTADPADDLNATAILPRVVDRMDTVATEPVEVVLALGANVGDAQDTLRRAVAELAAVSGLTITDVGPLARTAPVGGPEQPDFLNTVVLATTTLSPRELLHACQSVEADHGRQRLEHWGPRTLDIDLIVYGALVHSSDDLDIPHPRANERAFVLAPWAHLSPDAVLPGLGGGPVAALAATAPDRDGIRWLALDWLAEPDTSHQPPASILPARVTRPGVQQPDGEPVVVPPAPPL